MKLQLILFIVCLKKVIKRLEQSLKSLNLSVFIGRDQIISAEGTVNVTVGTIGMGNTFIDYSQLAVFLESSVLLYTAISTECPAGFSMS